MGFLADMKRNKALRQAQAERGQRMYGLYQQGETTSAEILKADFGTDNPKGLDITSAPDNPVKFAPLSELHKERSFLYNVYDHMRVGGRAGVGKEIYINPSSVGTGSGFANLVGHENVHTMQGVEASGGWDSSFANSHCFNMIYGLPGDTYMEKASSLTAKFTRAVYDISSSIPTVTAAFPFIRPATGSVSKYYAKDCEVQARMHEIMATGYAEWQRMPVNKTELWAALHNMGVTTPSSVEKELKGTPEGKQALEDFSCSYVTRMAVQQDVTNINKVFGYAATSRMKGYLWHTAFPALYGNLIELYGDSQGRARMDMGVNPKPARDLVSAIVNHPESLEGGRMDELVDAVPPKLANNLVNALICQSSVNPEKAALAEQALDKLLARDDIRKQLQSENLYDMSKPLFERPCLTSAVYEGNVNITRKLIEAGVNPVSSYQIRDPFGKTQYCPNVLAILSLDARTLHEMKNEPEQMPKALKKAFAGSVEKKQNFIAMAEKRLACAQVIADAYPDLDKPQPVKLSEETTVTKTARELLDDVKGFFGQLSLAPAPVAAPQTTAV